MTFILHLQNLLKFKIKTIKIKCRKYLLKERKIMKKQNRNYANSINNNNNCNANISYRYN